MNRGMGGRSILARVIGRLRHRRGAPAPPLDAPLPPSPGHVGPLKSRPIFIIGVQRSGTSLLRRIVDAHPRLACPPESRFILPLARLINDAASMRGLESMGYSPEQITRSIARFADGFLRGYAEEQGKQRWADKTPHYVDCLDDIHRLFGADAQFIIIVRHGMDVAYSLSDPHRHYPAIDGHVAAEGGNRPIGAARFWNEKARLIEDFRSKHPMSCIQIRYEDLTSRPESALRSVFTFLDEEWDQRVLDYNRFPHHVGMEDPDVKRRRRIEPNSHRYLSWRPDVQREVRAACQPMLSILTYE